MYLHAGNNRTVRKSAILGIFDLDHATASRVTKQFLSRAEKQGQVELTAEELPKSFLVTAEPLHPGGTSAAPAGGWKTQKIYLSQLASATLTQRAETRVL